MKHTLLLTALAMLSGCGLEYGVYDSADDLDPVHYAMELLEPTADTAVLRSGPGDVLGDQELISAITACRPDIFAVCNPLPYPDEPELYLESWMYYSLDLGKVEGDPEMISQIRFVGWSHYGAGANNTEPDPVSQFWWGPITLEVYAIADFDEDSVSWNTRGELGDHLDTVEIDDITAKPVMVPETEDEWMASGVDLTDAILDQERDLVSFALVPVPDAELGYPYLQQMYGREIVTNPHYGEDGYEHRQVPRFVVSYH